jgi:hypothetical protein
MHLLSALAQSIADGIDVVPWTQGELNLLAWRIRSVRGDLSIKPTADFALDPAN